MYRDELVSSISDKIEKNFGRKKPFICKYGEYEKNKVAIDSQLTHKEHFTQKNWPESTKVLLETLDENDGYDSLSSSGNSRELRYVLCVRVMEQRISIGEVLFLKNTKPYETL